MKKLEALKQLLEVIKNKQLASGSYCSQGNHCVIGHLMKIGGATGDNLETIQSTNPYQDWYSIDAIIKFIIHNNMKDDIVAKSLTNCGFDINLKEDVELLSRLQVTNDGDPKEEVIKAIEAAILELEEN